MGVLTTSTWLCRVMLLPPTRWCLRWGRSLNASSSCDIITNIHIVRDTAVTCMTSRTTCMNSSWSSMNRWVWRFYYQQVHLNECVDSSLTKKTPYKVILTRQTGFLPMWHGTSSKVMLLSCVSHQPLNSNISAEWSRCRPPFSLVCGQLGNVGHRLKTYIIVPGTSA